MRLKSYILVAIQLAGIVYLILTGHLLAAPPFIFLEIAGVALGLWAILTMQPQRVTPLPEPKHNAPLVTRGPYRWIRHPMYTSVLLFTVALLLDKTTTGRLLVWLGLVVVLLIKIQHEEALLVRHFPGYAAYRKRTKKLLPYIFTIAVL